MCRGPCDEPANVTESIVKKKLKCSNYRDSIQAILLMVFKKLERNVSVGDYFQTNKPISLKLSLSILGFPVTKET